MAKVINCDCGAVIRGGDDDELVRKAEAHVAEAHPDLVGKMTRETFLGMAEDA